VEARRELMEAVRQRYRAAGRIKKSKFSTSSLRLRGTANMQFALRLQRCPRDAIADSLRTTLILDIAGASTLGAT